MASSVELYTAAGCEFSAAAREDLEWRGVDFVEYDVEKDREAYERMLGTHRRQPDRARDRRGGQTRPGRLDGPGVLYLAATPRAIGQHQGHGS